MVAEDMWMVVPVVSYISMNQHRINVFFAFVHIFLALTMIYYRFHVKKSRKQVTESPVFGIFKLFIVTVLLLHGSLYVFFQVLFE